jgi:phosphoesterase RecJ-like protein
VIVQPSQRDEQRALDLLRRSRSVLLCGHGRPDGDVLGSQTGLAWVLVERGHRVHIVNPDPPAPRFDFLEPPVPFTAFGGGDAAEQDLPAHDLPVHDLIVLCDGSELSRAETLGEHLARSPAPKLVIDHHLPPPRAWWDAALIDPTAAATAVLVRRLAAAFGVALHPRLATGLFTALASDTGWFRHGNCDAQVLTLAAELVAAGAVPEAIHRHLFRRTPPERPRLLGELLSSARYACDGRLALLEIPAATEERIEAGEHALEILRAVAGVELVFVLRELGPQRCKLSARSEGDLDVQALAARFGGGGHRRAAGAELRCSLAEARALLRAAAEELLAQGAARATEGRAG